MDGAITAITRRRLLQAGGAAAAGAVVGLRPGGALASGLTGGDPSAPDYLRRATYAGLGDARFTVTGTSGSTPLTLTGVSDLTPELTGADDAFSLAFSGPTSTLAQATRTFSHSTLGTFDLFVVPVDPPTSEQHFQVIVDRSVRSGSASAPTSPQGDGGAPQSAAGISTPHAAGAGHGPAAHESAVRHLSVRRGSHGVLVALSLAAGAHVRFVRVWLKRGRHVLGVAEHHVTGQHASFRVSTARRVAGGRYGLVIATTDADGVESMVPHEIVLH